MNFSLKAIFVTATALMQVSSSPLGADEKGQKNQQADRKRIESLIAELRSPNKDPNPKSERFITFPKDYDFKAQARVEKARKELLDLKKAAFPILIEHLKDKEYSRSIPTAIIRSQSVGEVCFTIVEEQVDLAGTRYKSRKGADGKEYRHQGYFSQYCQGAWYSQDGLRNWWKEHESRSLKDMQIEALEWAIERERKIGFPGAKDRATYLKPLVEQLMELEKR